MLSHLSRRTRISCASGAPLVPSVTFVRHATNFFTNKPHTDAEPFTTADEERGMFRVLDIGKPNPKQFTVMAPRGGRAKPAPAAR
jgi:hypothetical protein